MLTLCEDEAVKWNFINALKEVLPVSIFANPVTLEFPPLEVRVPWVHLGKARDRRPS